jgi:hypothetical protein
MIPRSPVLNTLSLADRLLAPVKPLYLFVCSPHRMFSEAASSCSAVMEVNRLLVCSGRL